MDIDGIGALVTGGAGGLGEATARHLAARGAVVTIFDRDGAKAEAIAADLGGRARAAAGDVTSEADTQAAVETAAAGAPLGIVVACAGGARGGGRTVEPRRQPARPRAVPGHRRPEPGRHVQHRAPRRRGDGRAGAVQRRRRARRDRHHRVDRGLRGPDRPGRVRRGEGRDHRHDDHPRPRPGGHRRARQLHRSRARWARRAWDLAPAEMREQFEAKVPFPARFGHPEEFAALAEHLITNRLRQRPGDPARRRDPVRPEVAAPAARSGSDPVPGVTDPCRAHPSSSSTVRVRPPSCRARSTAAGRGPAPRGAPSSRSRNESWAPRHHNPTANVRIDPA